jgi:hypothetical protein
MQKGQSCTILLLFLSSIVSAQVHEDLVCSEKAQLQSLLQFRSSSKVYHGYQIHYNRCFWRVNPSRNGYLQGNVFSAFVVDKNADSIGFDLQMQMQVDSVIYQGVKIPFSRANDAVYCHKPGGWTSGRDSVTIYYQGNPQTGSGFGYYVWDNHLTAPIVHTLSEPYGASYWWPCKQTLADKIDSLDIFVSTIPAYKAASNGLLITSDSVNDSTRIFHWKHRYPVATYLVAIAVTNYQEFTDQATFHNRSETMPVLNYVFPQSLSDAKRDAPQVLPMLRLFDSLFGEYPFVKEKYGHAQFTWGGGMEHQTMSFMVNFSYDLMAHELAHQWFGDMVTCGSWADLWLNEGFATYATAICFQYLRPWEWTQKLSGIRNAATSQDNGSVFVQDTNTINRLFSGNLTYNKGAFLLHMLRVKIGDQAFFSGIRKYLVNSDHAYGFARTTDLQEALENESGIDLDPFFQRWFYGEGFPYLKMSWKQSGDQVQLQVQQTPSHGTVPVFDLLIPIRFRNGNTDSLLYFHNTKNNENFLFHLPFSADSAEFDPFVTILARASLGGINLDNVNTGNFQVAPNPVRDKLGILSNYNIAEKVQIYDMTGRLVYETGTDFVAHLGERITLDIAALGNGTYVTKVYTKKSVTSLLFNKI